MSGKQFIPNLEAVKESVSTKKETDGLTGTLIKATRILVLSLFLLVPIFFTSGLWATLGFDKTMLAIVVVGTTVIISSFIALRMKSFKTILPMSLGVYLLFIIAAFFSAIYVGDTTDSIRGSYFEVQTVGFLSVMGLMILLPLLFQNDAKSSVKAIMLFIGSAGLIALFNLIRILADGQILGFNSFNTLTLSPVGSFNDLAIFSALSIILSLLFLVRLNLSAIAKYLLSALVVISTFLLAVVNFFDIWLVVSFTSLILLVYLLAQDTLFPGDDKEEKIKPVFAIAMSTLVFVVGVSFLVFGDSANNLVQRIADVEFVEVIPSREGTLGIARSVISDSPVLGIGPNRFADAWRLYKDPSINSTIFWETDFNTGSGFVPTLIINTGLLGGGLFILFQVFFVLTGLRALLANSNKEDVWYTVTLTSFVASLFIWCMSYIYEPNQAILLIGALFTGLTLAGVAELMPRRKVEINLITSQKRGFIFMALSIVVVSNTVIMMMSISKQYIAQANFNESQATALSVEEFEAVASDSYELFPDDRFSAARAQIKLAEINSLLGVANPSEEDQQRFLSAVEQAQIFINQALGQDNTNPDNHALLGGVFRGLSVAGIDGARERAEAAITEARNLDPQNPGYLLLLAQLDITTGDTETARAKINEALALKGNFTEALFLLTQIDIREGNTEAAIETTRSIISLEPQNPTRYFQLGMLQSSVEDYEGAVQSFQRAISLDNQFANARYLLALTYITTEETDLALEQLQLVQVTNPDNQDLQNLINQLASGEEIVVPDLGLEIPVNEISPQSTGEEVTSPFEEGSDLLEAVNPVSSQEETIENDAVTEDTAEEEEIVEESTEEEVEEETAN